MGLPLSLTLLALLAAVICADTPNPNVQWDKDFALRFVRYSYSAYCQKQKLVDWDCTYCTHGTSNTSEVQYYYNSTGNNAGYSAINHDHEEILLVFRGTDPLSLKNWIDDFEFIKLDYDWPPFVQSARVHSGFWASYMHLKAQLMPVLRDLLLRFPTYRLRVSGHSLGAAMVNIVAMDLTYIEQIDNTRMDVITFGAPRVGNFEFSKAFGSKFPGAIRVTHDDDPVPHLPFEVMNFHHVPTEVWQNILSGYKICDGSGEDPQCSDILPLDIDVVAHLTYMDVVLDGCP